MWRPCRAISGRGRSRVARDCPSERSSSRDNGMRRWRLTKSEGRNASLSFWFGETDRDGLASEDQVARWWKKDTSFDERIRTQFASEHAAILRGERDEWLSSARGRLAYVIVLDQFFPKHVPQRAGHVCARPAGATCRIGGDRPGHGPGRIRRPALVLLPSTDAQ